MFNNLTVSRRLMLSFGALVALLLAVSGLTLYCMAQMRASTEEITGNWLPSIETLGSMNVAKSDIRVLEWRHINSVDQAGITEVDRRIEARRADFEKLREAYNKLISSDEERRIYDAVVADWANYLRIQDELLTLSRKNENDRAGALMRGPSKESFDKIVAGLQKAIDLNHEGAMGEVARSDKLYDTARGGMALGVLLATTLAIGLGWLLTRSITRELGGEPAEAAQVASAISAGDLSRPIPLAPGDQTSMMARLAAMQEGLRKVVAGVRGNSESVATAASQIAQGNHDLSQRTEEQASALQQTAATMEELSTTVRHNTDNAKQANQLAQGASSIAAKGGEVVERVVSTMRDISGSSRRIGDIIGVIDGIAFQTNILALNAAVEAARAGEQGRGFAVVAGEVRTLAQRSADAAKEIKTLIGGSMAQVEQGTELVEQAGQTMGEIVGAIRRVSDIVAEITSASVEQNAGISQVGDAVGQMDKVTQQNAALVEESAAAAESLRTQAQHLVQAVAVFKLADATA